MSMCNESLVGDVFLLTGENAYIQSELLHQINRSDFPVFLNGTIPTTDTMSFTLITLMDSSPAYFCTHKAVCDFVRISSSGAS